MSDINTALEGLDPALVEQITSPAVMEKLSAWAEKGKEPVLSKNSELLGKYNALNEQIKGFGGMEAIQGIVSAAKQAELQQAEQQRNSSNIEEMRSRFEKELADKDSAYSQLQNAWVSERKTAELTKALADAGADASLLGLHADRRVKAELIEGKVALTVLDESGQPMFTKGAKAATLGDLMDEYKSKYAAAFTASTETGSGAKGGAGTANVSNPWLKETKNFTKQMEMIASDPEMAKKLAAIAGVKLPI